MYNKKTKKLKFIFKRGAIVGKGENPGYYHFLFFPQSFQKLSFSGSSRVMNSVIKGLIFLYLQNRSGLFGEELIILPQEI